MTVKPKYDSLRSSLLDLSNKPNIIEAATTKMIPSHNNMVKCKLMCKPPKY